MPSSTPTTVRPMSEEPTRGQPQDAYFSASGHGRIEFDCIGVDFGSKVISSEGQSRADSVIYIRKVVDSQISVMVHHPDREHYIKFNDWLLKYGMAIGRPDNTTSPITIGIPALHFIRSAVPKQAGEFGDKTAAFAYEQTITFEPASDYLGVGRKLLSNKPTLPTDPEAAAHYPTAQQLKGDQHLANALYDVQTATTVTSPWEGGSFWGNPGDDGPENAPLGGH